MSLLSGWSTLRHIWLNNSARPDECGNYGMTALFPKDLTHSKGLSHNRQYQISIDRVLRLRDLSTMATPPSIPLKLSAPVLLNDHGFNMRMLQYKI